jgi:hypothetical protein
MARGVNGCLNGHGSEMVHEERITGEASNAGYSPTLMIQTAAKELEPRSKTKYPRVSF